MYCAACNLRYPDHLNFCRRCGQSLSRSASDVTPDSVCCTRCGARAVRGENYCQQCGHRVTTGGIPETVVGACYHCGTPWRSGWLFCKTCGLDRDRALLLPTSLPAVSPKNLAAEAEKLPQIEKVFCKRCGAQSKPYSRFCESCGNTLDLSKNVVKEEAVAEAEEKVITGKLLTPPAPAVFRTQIDASSSKSPTASMERGQRPTLLDPLTDASGRKTDAFGEPVRTSNIAAASIPTVPSISTDTRPDMVVTSSEFVGQDGVSSHEFSSFQGVSAAEMNNSHPKAAPKAVNDPARLVQKSDSLGAVVVWMIILILAVGAGFVAWRLFNDQRQQASSAGDQAEAQPAPEAATAASPDAAPSAEPSAVASVTAPNGMVYVPGGTFKMGREGGDEFESPTHTVSVKPFFIDRTEVTNEEYQRFVSAEGHRAPAHWPDGKFPEGQAKFPVVNVSWDDAKAYARWANKRLPTEAEWEFAARGTDNRLYPWGDPWNQDYANAGREKNGSLVAVGSFPTGASPFGAFDMCGNAWEWTASDYEDYPGRKSPTALAGAGLKVIRGGGYDVSPKSATTTYRGAIPPDRVPDKTGFRLARDVQ
jgi:formylglycine-generating enzyme required for sulfatase activity